MSVALAELRPARRAAAQAFWALLLRDMAVLRKRFMEFVVRTVMQPILLVFVFTYVFPKIGQGIGGARAAAMFSTILIPGVVATTVIFQGIQAVALPLVQEFGYTREIEDRVMSPMPVWAVAGAKVTAGALQAMLAAAVVFPLAAIIPATEVHLSVRWPHLIAMCFISFILSAALGLAIGTKAAPQQVPLVFGLIVIPITFLGAIYYPWMSLTPIPWLKWFVLINPLVYMSEGFRMALAPGIPHMPAVVIYAALSLFTAALLWLGMDGFARRVLS